MSGFSSQFHLLEQQPPNETNIQIILRIRKPSQAELLKYRKIRINDKKSRSIQLMAAKSHSLFKSTPSRRYSRGRSASPSSSELSPFRSKRSSRTPRSSRNSATLDNSAIQNSQFCSDFPYALFTTGDLNPVYAIASERPVCDKIMTELQDSRLLGFCKNGIISTDAFLFKYDGVFSQLQSQQKFYTKCLRGMVHQLVLGKSSAAFIFGAHDSGKSHTIRGGQSQERGLLLRAAEDVFNFFQLNRSQFQPPPAKSHFSGHYDLTDATRLPKPSAAKTSIYRYTFRYAGVAVVRERVYDLSIDFSTARNPQALICEDGQSLKQRKFTKVKNIAELQKLLRKGRKQWERIRGCAHSGASKGGHFIHSLRVDRQKRQKASGEEPTISTLDVVELISSQEAINDQHTAHTFNALSNALVKTASEKNKDLMIGRPPFQAKSTLLKYINAPFQSLCKVKLIVTAAPGLEPHFKHTLAALKFSSEIRYHILKNQTRGEEDSPPSVPPTQTESETQSQAQYMTRAESQMFVARMNEDLAMIRQEIVEREVHRADTVWAEERRQILDEMLKLANENGVPKSLLEDIVLLQSQLELKAQEFVRGQTMKVRSSPLRGGGPGVARRGQIMNTLQSQKDTPQFSGIRGRREQDQAETRRLLQFYTSPKQKLYQSVPGPSVQPSIPFSESSIKHPPYEPSGEVSPIRGFSTHKSRNNQVIRQISDEQDEAIEHDRSLISEAAREGFLEQPSRLRQQFLSNQPDLRTSGQQIPVTSGQRIKQLERQITFKDEIIAKYEDLFGGGISKENISSYSNTSGVERQKYEKMIADLRDRLRERNSQLSDLQGELQNTIRGGDMRLKAKNRDLEDQLESLKRKYRDRGKVVEDMELKLRSLDEQTEDRVRRMNEREGQQTYIKLETAKSEVKALQREREELSLSRKDLVDKVSALQVEINQITIERNQVKDQFARLLEQSQRQICELEVASNELGIYREKNEMKQSSKIKELANQNQILLKNLADLKIQLSDALSGTTNWKREFEIVEAAKAEVESELNYLRSQQAQEINMIDMKCDSVREENMRLLEDNNNVREREVELKKEIRRLERARDSYKEQYLELKAETKQLREERARHLEIAPPQARSFQKGEEKSRMVTDIKDLIAQYKMEKQVKHS